ncbi:MAG: acyl carrier protein [Burkholderiaceae bacterium]
MNDDDIRRGILATLREVAPEVEPGELSATRPLRNQVDLDSMDWLNVIIGWHKRFGIDIPEADYARLTTLDAVVRYVRERCAPGAGGGA